MQKVYSYIENQPEQYQVVIHQLRELILDTSPKIEEKFSYQCPFYYFKRPLAYIYVSNKKPGKVLLGICDGAQLSNAQGLLTGEDRKQIRLIEICVDRKPNWKAISELLNEAIILQEIT